MNFETKTIRSKNWRKTPYGVISIILFGIATIVVFVLGPKDGMMEKDYLTEWFGTYKKPFLWLNLLFYLNGIYLMVVLDRRNCKSIGSLLMTDETIKITQLAETKTFNIAEIATIRLKYFGYKAFWKSRGAGTMSGNMNYLTIVDQQDEDYSCEFFLGSYTDKRNLIKQLIYYRNQGIKIKLDYVIQSGVYPTDIDFSELKM